MADSTVASSTETLTMRPAMLAAISRLLLGRISVFEQTLQSTGAFGFSGDNSSTATDTRTIRWS